LYKDALKKPETAEGFVIPIAIMAIAWVAAHNHNPIRTLAKRSHDMLWVNATATHHTD
jgi:hypothetical protein